MKFKIMMLKDGVWLSAGVETTNEMYKANKQITYLTSMGGTFQFKVQVLYV